MKIKLNCEPIYEETGVPEGSMESRNRNLRLRGTDENGKDVDLHFYSVDDQKKYAAYKGGDVVEVDDSVISGLQK